MANSNLPMPTDFGEYKVGSQVIKLTPELIKSAICPNLTEIEILNFGYLCQQNNLNPFVKEAYAVKYGSSPASLIIAKQGFANRAERSGHLKSKTGGVIVARQNPKSQEWETQEVKGSFVPPSWVLCGGWAIVTRDDRDEAFEERVMLSEYKSDKNPLWASKAATMIAKVAMQHALRDAFPIEQGGVYIEEEFSDDLNPNKTKNVPQHSDFDEDPVQEAEIIEEVKEDSKTEK